MAHRHDIKNTKLLSEKKIPIQFSFNLSDYRKRNDGFDVTVELVSQRESKFTRKLILWHSIWTQYPGWSVTREYIQKINSFVMNLICQHGREWEVNESVLRLQRGLLLPSPLAVLVTHRDGRNKSMISTRFPDQSLSWRWAGEKKGEERGF